MTLCLHGGLGAWNKTGRISAKTLGGGGGQGNGPEVFLVSSLTAEIVPESEARVGSVCPTGYLGKQSL